MENKGRTSHQSSNTYVLLHLGCAIQLYTHVQVVLPTVQTPNSKLRGQEESKAGQSARVVSNVVGHLWKHPAVAFLRLSQRSIHLVCVDREWERDRGEAHISYNIYIYIYI
jgi:hypothetical protein